MINMSDASVSFRSRKHLWNIIFRNHAIAESLEKLQEIFKMHSISLHYGLPWNVIKVIFDNFRDEVDNSLNFLTSRKSLVLPESKEVDDSFWENNFAYFEVNLFALENIDIFNPTPDSHILENVYGDVYYRWLVWALALVHFNNKLYYI